MKDFHLEAESNLPALIEGKIENPQEAAKLWTPVPYAGVHLVCFQSPTPNDVKPSFHHQSRVFRKENLSSPTFKPE